MTECACLRSARNRGSGSSRRTGTLAARGRVVVWTDADLTYPNHEIPLLVDALGDADQIVGARTSEAGTLKVLRVPAKWAIRRLASHLTGARIPDLNSGYRAMRRDVALQFVDLLPAGFSCVSTITMAFLSNGYSVRYTPISYGPRTGRSKFRWWADTRRYALQVVRMILSHNPLRVFLPATAVLGAAFAAKLGYDLVEKDLRVATNTLLLGFATIQMLAVGLLADVVVRSAGPQRLVPPADVSEGSPRAAGGGRRGRRRRRSGRSGRRGGRRGTTRTTRRLRTRRRSTPGGLSPAGPAAPRSASARRATNTADARSLRPLRPDGARPRRRPAAVSAPPRSRPVPCR